jgi:hypothetical protein
MRLKSGLAVVAVLAVAGAAGMSSVSASTAATTPPVPAPYRALVATLNQQVSSFATEVGSSSSKGHTVLAASLIAADGNIGQGLLAPAALTRASTMLRRLHQMGPRGVMLEVGFPLLLPSFANSTGYTSFYEQLAAMIHADGMTLSIEQNPVFASSQISSLHPDFSGLTVASYADEQRQEAQIIIDTMHPSYLTVLDEPDTFGSNLSLPLNAPATGVALVERELSGLNRGSTKVGAGTGTWTSPAYDEALLTGTSIDYLSVHVYPLAQADVDNLNTDVSAAAQAHKPVVMDETWLYKDLLTGNFDSTGTIHANPAGAANEQKLDTYSFFEPIDQRFLTLITRYARTHGVLFVSPFSTLNFFASVDWTPALDAASEQVPRAAQSRAAVAAMTAGTLTTVGTGYRQLARGG